MIGDVVRRVDSLASAPGVAVLVAGEVSRLAYLPEENTCHLLVPGGGHPSEVGALLDTYAQAQLEGLKVALLAAAAIALLSLFLTRQLPTTRLADAGPAGAPRMESARSA